MATAGLNLLPLEEFRYRYAEEMLSPEDRVQRVIAKCRNYQRIGIRSIFVLDPEFRDAWEWSSTTRNLERISTMTLPNGKQIVIEDLWSEFARQLRND